MRDDVLGFHEIDRTTTALVGGKGAALGELSRLPGVQVPPGFCITTAAFERALGPALAEALDRLARLPAADQDAIQAAGAAVRQRIEAIALPPELQDAIAGALAGLEGHVACAVRSSATAEDLPGASFAGQHDTFLGIVGLPAILDHVRRCWASLFTGRAIAYRLHHGLDPRTARMAVVVQRMLAPRASGVLFTADPVTGHRRVASIEAVPGLGDALVAGHVNADAYRVRDGQVAAERVGPRPVLADAEALALEALGRRIESHFGQPQDVEWCLADGAFHVVQSRPITTLFPIPETGEPGNRVFISVGHQQMMMDALRPLGLSVFQAEAARPMFAAGGRLFVDITQEMTAPASRAALMGLLGTDPLIKDALTTLVAREGFFGPPPEDAPAPARHAGPPPGTATPPDDEAAIVDELIAQSQASLAALRDGLQARSGLALVDFILADIARSRQGHRDPRSFALIMAGLTTRTWLDDHMQEWLGEKGVADTLSRSVPHNVTSEMGLALLDVADVIRPHPVVVAYLRGATDDGFLEGLAPLPGGVEARDALAAFLDRYGMRGAGEIDVTRPRWAERPTMLVPTILGHVANCPPGEGRRRFEQGRRDAQDKERELLARLAQLPDGARKAEETRRQIARLRRVTGYREYPKYAIVSRYFLYKQALLRAAGHLVASPEDLFFLTLPELREAVRTSQVDGQLVARRREAHARHERLTPPRILTSEGEAVAGAYRRADLPAGVLAGLAVSTGVVEGRARVVFSMADAELAPGDILVTPFTDPSWTPAFLAVRGLITEVGSLMSHGAVIAREYGLPAVVGVERATSRIKDGQRVRVHGADGYVELLD